MTMVDETRLLGAPRIGLLRLLVVCVPPLVAVAAVAAFLIVERVVAVGSPPAATVADAAARGAAARAVELILDGADPNGTGLVPAGVLGAESFELHPIEAAILGRRPELVALLIRQGAVVPDRDRAACLARRTAFEEVLPALGVTEPPAAAGTPVGPGEAWAACTRKKIEVRSTG
jgi:hypothetical protein